MTIIEFTNREKQIEIMTTMTVLLILLALLLIKIREYSCATNDINDAKLGHSLLQNGWVMCPVGVDSSHSSCLNATIPGTVLTNLLKHQFFGFQESVHAIIQI